MFGKENIRRFIHLRMLRQIPLQLHMPRIRWDRGSIGLQHEYLLHLKILRLAVQQFLCQQNFRHFGKGIRQIVHTGFPQFHSGGDIACQLSRYIIGIFFRILLQPPVKPHGIHQESCQYPQHQNPNEDDWNRILQARIVLMKQ